jgi:mRNA interferase MazF
MKGEVVVIPFPFTDLSSYKKRPAVILIDLPGQDIVCAAITSSTNDPHAISLGNSDFERGNLNRPSLILPTKLFTCERSRIEKVVGKITEQKRSEITSRIVALIS